jgi:hypothetical protein
MKPNRVKDCLDQYRSALLLTEVLADKKRQEQIADTIEMYPVTVSHAKTRQEILAAKKAAACSCPYHRGGNMFGCSGNAQATDYQAVRGY